MSIIHYNGKDETNPFDEGLATRQVEDGELLVQISYCLQCPCGVFKLSGCNEVVISLTNCPRASQHMYVYFNPRTGEKYQRDLPRQNREPINYCEVYVACTYEETSIPLKDMLVIPEGWTLEVEDDRDFSSHIDLDQDMTLHRIPDVVAYRKWQMDEVETKNKKQREKDIVSLRNKLKELTGEDG